MVSKGLSFGEKSEFKWFNQLLLSPPPFEVIVVILYSNTVQDSGGDSLFASAESTEEVLTAESKSFFSTDNFFLLKFQGLLELLPLFCIAKISLFSWWYRSTFLALFLSLLCRMDMLHQLCGILLSACQQFKCLVLWSVVQTGNNCSLHFHFLAIIIIRNVRICWL